MAHMASISPKCPVAISTTATWCSGRSPPSATARPNRPLKFPGVRKTVNRVASTSAMSSLVPVLPTVPVTATTRGAQARTTWAP